ncbi:F-box/FBD/LRR-repeat protein At1g13570-like [Lycium barbarum]|uniref:F-box/FBD/LRR-repeat protein At1g13570-like n=1 Tax=Lycium barbarum TaxID=112863 RepID=UPI00293F0E9C|nr:F-box/FBD/LRR-repeat protein At1g13570-like [Lycium barbarum]XP_060210142.1 F-box/FBD/LRR-repeat protein At1g13570-like [Lycium barbarum]
MSPSDTSQVSIADEDIISDLPRNVIDCILGKMPIREAIRTSVLSKKWRFYYLTIPNLVFDYKFGRELCEFLARKNCGKFSAFELKYQFNEIVTKSLMLHPGRIEKFEVSIPSSKSTEDPDGSSAVVHGVNKWMLYLSGRSINKLTLICNNDLNYRHKLPPYFFSCPELTFLKLKNFVLSPPLEFKGFLNLYRLQLIGVDFANSCFESFLSSCPVLKRLNLHHCSGIQHFNISSTNLKRLFIEADDELKSISLEKAPNLSEVSVYLKRVVIGPEGNHVSDLVMFVGSLPNVKLLRLDGKCLQLLAEPPVPTMISRSPYSLKILELKSLNFMDFDQISVVVCLLRSAPNLQELSIEASTIKINQDQVSGYLKLLDCADFPLRNLHLVKLTKISFCDPELQFMAFLHRSTPLPVTMIIQSLKQER